MTAFEDTGQYLRNYRDGYDTKVVITQVGIRRTRTVGQPALWLDNVNLRRNDSGLRCGLSCCISLMFGNRLKKSAIDAARRPGRIARHGPIEKSRLTAQEILPSQSRAFGGSSCLFATAQR